MRFEYAARTHVGRRANNEDALCAEPALGLFAVADGMGGYDGGEVASQLVIGALTRFFRRCAGDAEVTWPFAVDAHRSQAENMVSVAVRAAHNEVVARKHGPLRHMGSTVAALVLREREAVVGYCGDSRVYRLRDGRLAQLTRDHSLYAELEEARTPGLVPREQFPYANVITRAVGMGDGKPDVFTEPLRRGDVFLLCTDGLVEKLAPEAIAAVLGSTDPHEACSTLVEEAFLLGGRDNITAVVVRVLDDEARQAA
jgi:serine/threonine protein phosphatase PrpC